MMNTVQHTLHILHDLLVKEFRAYQALDALLEDEHRVLVVGNSKEWLEVSKRKTGLLDKLLRIGVDRQEAQRTLGGILEIDLPKNLITEESQIRTAIDRESARRITCLGVGIQLLMDRVHEWNCVNRALASITLTQINLSQIELFREHQVEENQILSGQDSIFRQ